MVRIALTTCYGNELQTRNVLLHREFENGTMIVSFVHASWGFGTVEFRRGIVIDADHIVSAHLIKR